MGKFEQLAIVNLACRTVQCFFELQSLKFLDLQLKDHECYLIDALEQLSQMKNLQTLKLIIIINQIKYSHPQASHLKGKHFSQIPSLTSLAIDFSGLYLADPVMFISELKPLKKLNELSLFAYSDQYYEKQQEINIKDLDEVFRNLKALNISIKDNSGNIEMTEIFTYSIQKSSNIQNLRLFCSFGFCNMTHNTSNLRYLYLQFSFDLEFHEDNLIQMLNDISENLQLIDLTLLFRLEGKISQTIIQTYGNCIQKLNHLTSLSLHMKQEDYKIDNLGFLCILQGLGSLFKLEQLTLDFKIEMIRFDSMKQLFISINQNQSLKMLTLMTSGKAFLSEQLEQLDSYIQFPSKIVSLIFQIQLTTNFKNNEKLIQELSKLYHLNTLRIFLGRLIMTNEDIIRLASYLKNLKLLTDLSLDNDQFNMLYLTQLYQSIDTLKFIIYKRKYKFQTQIQSVKYENLFQNNNLQETNFKGGEKKDFTIFLQFSKKFLLSEEQLANKQFDCIPFVFENLKMLTKFSFILPKDNKLTQEAVTILFTEFRNLHNLKEFILKIEPNNEIGNEGIILLINILRQLPSLKKLNLSIQSENCCINWSKAHEFYYLIGKLKSLNSLSICIESPEQLGEAKYYTKAILQNIGFLQNLTEFKINLDINKYQWDFNYLFELFSNFTNNLRSLTVYFSDIKLQYKHLLERSILMLKRLSYLVINSFTHLQQAKKCMRLVQQKVINKFS